MTTLLCILDGLGINPDSRANAFLSAKTPTLSELFASAPWSTLHTHGERVGLPAGQMGNSEVGHLNIGAGRVVEQWLLRIARGFERGLRNESAPYARALTALVDAPSIHVIGLLSDGGVHSHVQHATMLIQDLLKETAAKIVVHIITDGRDTAPKAARAQIELFLSSFTTEPRVVIGSVLGRYFAMDRDTRWDRTFRAVDAITASQGLRSKSALSAIDESYLRGATDEFLEPTIVTPTPITPHDGVIFFNFRADRMRQLVRALCLGQCPQRKGAAVFKETASLCMTEYDGSFGLPYVFDSLPIVNHIGEVVAQAGLRQLRVAETEKYPHVTYFHNGGQEEECQGESRTLIPSPRDVATYDLKPEMSADGVCNAVVHAIENKTNEFIVVNFANCDMVGHTGVLSAAIRAVEKVDECLGRIITALRARGGNGLVIADHGNAEQMVQYDTGIPHTSHTLYPVPAILIEPTKKYWVRSGGALCDVAPTLLQLLNLRQPKEMTGASLLVDMA